MRRKIGAAAAGAILCVLTLAGCAAGHHRAADTSGAGAGAGTATTAPATDGGSGSVTDGVPLGTPTGAAAVDSELDSVDQQLGAANSDLSQATAKPSDGD